MCALCAVLGSSSHWSDMAGRESFRMNDNKVTRRMERRHRLSLVQPIFDFYGLKLQDLAGSSYLVSNNRGEEASVYQLESIWAKAELFAGRPCDPLDPDLLNHLSQRNTTRIDS